MIIFNMRKIPDFSFTPLQLRIIAGVCLIVVIVTSVLSWGRIFFHSKIYPVCPEKISAAAEKIDPNIAGEASLRRLKGMGETRAASLMDYRNKSSDGMAFKNLSDLTKVKGIGIKTAENWQYHLVFPQGVHE